MSKQALVMELIGGLIFAAYWTGIIFFLSMTAGGKPAMVDIDQSQSPAAIVGPPH